MTTIQIDEAELRDLLTERNHLRLQVAELQAQQSLMVEAMPSRCVRAFHKKFGHPVAVEPRVPNEPIVRFRIRLIAEEFCELLDATYHDQDADVRFQLSRVREALERLVRHLPHDVDLVAFVDALADLDYVVEGTRAAFGVRGEPIFAEVHRANLSKDPNGADGKPSKPPGWRPPEIERLLREQGWVSK